MLTTFALDSLQDLSCQTADTIIDVRAPAEFAVDHLPRAINLPVLSDAERARVGTIYAQDSPFAARKIGGALVAQNAAAHLQNALASHDGAWQPLVYCWRGGQRSGAFATILSQVGWRVQVLQGGYQSYRRHVVDMLYKAPLHHRFILIDGGTGTAKTALLHQLAAAGAQTLDLEGLAQHRGSLFGATRAAQPAQKLFETRLAQNLIALDPAQVTFLEAESSKIGERLLPPSLWAAMTSATRIQITAAPAARAAHLTGAYSDLTDDPAQLACVIAQLRSYHPAALIDRWFALIDQKDWHVLAAELIEMHYDPRYAKATARRAAPLHRFHLDALDPAALAKTASDIIDAVT
ncbi:MAG: tRNA 2-selenouridine(34) synthase MnmH [Pseudomonadota bacterium]